MWHLTHDTWDLTCDMWHVTHGGGWTFSGNFSSPALTVWDKQCIEDSKQKDHWLNQWMYGWINYKGVYRTATASPGLLIIIWVLISMLLSTHVKPYAEFFSIHTLAYMDQCSDQRFATLQFLFFLFWLFWPFHQLILSLPMLTSWAFVSASFHSIGHYMASV